MHGANGLGRPRDVVHAHERHAPAVLVVAHDGRARARQGSRVPGRRRAAILGLCHKSFEEALSARADDEARAPPVLAADAGERGAD